MPKTKPDTSEGTITANTKVNADGSLTVERGYGKNSDGGDMVSRFDIPPSQIAAHLRNADLTRGVAAGDLSAAQDSANQFDKQRRS